MPNQRFSKCKLCRRAGVKLFLRGEYCHSAKCPMVKRNYPPGVHGTKGRGKLSGYGEQLNEKQKAKRVYGLMERQFKKYYTLAKKQSGDSGTNLLQMLEMRLDNVVYRLGFAVSRGQARQMVNHGLFVVNGRRVDIPSYQIKIGDQISLAERSKKLKLFTNIKETLTKVQPPSWLSLELAGPTGKVLDRPQRDQAEASFDVKAIVEFYSR